MHSPPRARRAAHAATVCALATALAWPASLLHAGERVTAVQVAEAASALRADPLLGGTRNEPTWRLRRGGSDPGANDAASTLGWVAKLAGWLAEGGRALAWIIGAALAAMLLVTARRWMQVRGAAAGEQALGIPSHVRDLDIRPDSLPADIGAAARRHWQAGERRAALSLLYRGALSRLVHRHGVAIGAAATEGECVQAARATVAGDTAAYVARLVAAWQFAVYGGHEPGDAAVLAICDEFEARLG
ncbi:DUF4129 domain-containing protein [Piscinibacter koreensis]|uniref:DUF4129 domain-containing protein n=1 Tax=Piscinibacter koreensis TaxID=2742824 RepID=A0A7Y6NLQ4_9BURK|nr:DUF4129 domain-containing protein [Schlegelella koreensis]NUZ05426.1 DUF4129 domain-containing protein [Schlegelella koreensis]